MIKNDWEKKSTLKDKLKIDCNFLNLSHAAKLLPPPNPLIPRRNFPLFSPKFGNDNNYM